MKASLKESIPSWWKRSCSLRDQARRRLPGNDADHNCHLTRNSSLTSQRGDAFKAFVNPRHNSRQLVSYTPIPLPSVALSPSPFGVRIENGVSEPILYAWSTEPTSDGSRIPSDSSAATTGSSSTATRSTTSSTFQSRSSSTSPTRFENWYSPSSYQSSTGFARRSRSDGNGRDESDGSNASTTESEPGRRRRSDQYRCFSATVKLGSNGEQSLRHGC